MDPLPIEADLGSGCSRGIKIMRQTLRRQRPESVHGPNAKWRNSLATAGIRVKADTPRTARNRL